MKIAELIIAVAAIVLTMAFFAGLVYDAKKGLPRWAGVAEFFCGLACFLAGIVAGCIAGWDGGACASASVSALAMACGFFGIYMNADDDDSYSGC